MTRKYGVILAVLLIPVIGSAQNDVTFNLNMSVQAIMGNFDLAIDTVVVRGGTAPLAWAGYDNLLTDLDGDSIYTITIDFADATGTVEYKYVRKPAGADDVWEGVPNRTFELTGDPQTLPTVYFDDVSGFPIDGTVIWQVDMRVQEAVGNFTPGVDYITLRGGPPPLDWAENPLFVLSPWDTIYTISVLFNMPRHSTIEYKYNLVDSADWDNGDFFDGTWEAGDNRVVVFDPDADGFQILPLRHFNDIGPGDILMQDVTAMFRVDLRPVFEAIETQGYWYADGALDTVWSVDSMYIAGSVAPLEWVWDLTVIPEELRMYDDGVYPDEVADDTIYTVDIPFLTGTGKTIEYKYGVNGQDTEAGWGMNRFYTLDDTGAVYWVPVDLFGTIIGVEEEERLPVVSLLRQNYPNPFRSQTTIVYELPRTGTVTLTIHNILGQKVTTLIDDRTEAGVRTVGWDGKDSKGRVVPTGIYFARMEFENRADTKRLILMR